MPGTSEENVVVGLRSLSTARKTWSDFLPPVCAIDSAALAYPRRKRKAASKANLMLQSIHTFLSNRQFQIRHSIEIVNVGRSSFATLPRTSECLPRRSFWRRRVLRLPFILFPCLSPLVLSLFSTNGSNRKVCENIVTRWRIQ